MPMCCDVMLTEAGQEYLNMCTMVWRCLKNRDKSNDYEHHDYYTRPHGINAASWKTFGRHWWEANDWSYD